MPLHATVAEFPLSDARSGNFTRNNPIFTAVSRKGSCESGEENIYEEIKYGNAVDRNVILCWLCGTNIATVICDKCDARMFCLSCEDMYHRHPDRVHHVRKAIKTKTRPPLPPKFDQASQQQGPLRPPRKQKRSFPLFGSRQNQPGEQLKKESNVMTNLKKFMGVRPLPPPPTQHSDDSVNDSGQYRNKQQQQHLNRVLSHKQPAQQKHKQTSSVARCQLTAAKSLMTVSTAADTIQIAHHQNMDKSSYRGDFKTLPAATSGGQVRATRNSFGSPYNNTATASPFYNSSVRQAISMSSLSCPTCHGHGSVWVSREQLAVTCGGGDSLSSSVTSLHGAAAGSTFLRTIANHGRQPMRSTFDRRSAGTMSRRRFRTKTSISSFRSHVDLRRPVNSIDDEDSSCPRSEGESDSPLYRSLNSLPTTAADVWTCAYCLNVNNGEQGRCSACANLAPFLSQEHRWMKSKDGHFPASTSGDCRPAPSHAVTTGSLSLNRPRPDYCNQMRASRTNIKQRGSTDSDWQTASSSSIAPFHRQSHPPASAPVCPTREGLNAVKPRSFYNTDQRGLQRQMTAPDGEPSNKPGRALPRRRTAVEHMPAWRRRRRKLLATADRGCSRSMPASPAPQMPQTPLSSNSSDEDQANIRGDEEEIYNDKMRCDSIVSRVKRYFEREKPEIGDSRRHDLERTRDKNGAFSNPTRINAHQKEYSGCTERNSTLNRKHSQSQAETLPKPGNPVVRQCSLPVHQTSGDYEVDERMRSSQDRTSVPKDPSFLPHQSYIDLDYGPEENSYGMPETNTNVTLSEDPSPKDSTPNDAGLMSSLVENNRVRLMPILSRIASVLGASDAKNSSKHHHQMSLQKQMISSESAPENARRNSFSVVMNQRNDTIASCDLYSDVYNQTTSSVGESATKPVTSVFMSDRDSADDDSPRTKEFITPPQSPELSGCEMDECEYFPPEGASDVLPNADAPITSERNASEISHLNITPSNEIYQQRSGILKSIMKSSTSARCSNKRNTFLIKTDAETRNENRKTYVLNEDIYSLPSQAAERPKVDEKVEKYQQNSETNSSHDVSANRQRSEFSPMNEELAPIQTNDSSVSRLEWFSKCYNGGPKPFASCGGAVKPDTASWSQKSRGVKVSNSTCTNNDDIMKASTKASAITTNVSSTAPQTADQFHQNGFNAATSYRNASASNGASAQRSGSITVADISEIENEPALYDIPRSFLRTDSPDVIDTKQMQSAKDVQIHDQAVETDRNHVAMNEADYPDSPQVTDFVAYSAMSGRHSHKSMSNRGNDDHNVNFATKQSSVDSQFSSKEENLNDNIYRAKSDNNDDQLDVRDNGDGVHHNAEINMENFEERSIDAKAHFNRNKSCQIADRQKPVGAVTNSAIRHDQKTNKGSVTPNSPLDDQKASDKDTHRSHHDNHSEQTASVPSRLAYTQSDGDSVMSDCKAAGASGVDDRSSSRNSENLAIADTPPSVTPAAATRSRHVSSESLMSVSRQSGGMIVFTSSDSDDHDHVINVQFQPSSATANGVSVTASNLPRKEKCHMLDEPEVDTANLSREIWTHQSINIEYPSTVDSDYEARSVHGVVSQILVEVENMDSPETTERIATVTDSEDVELTPHDTDQSDSNESQESDGETRPEDEVVESVKEKIRSGQMISAGQNTNSDRRIKRRAKFLLERGDLATVNAAHTASQLIQMKFTRQDSIVAAEECNNLYAAINFLHQKCELCEGRYSAAQMVPMIHCVHRCCSDCATTYFTQLIKERSIFDLRCPFCNEPDLSVEEVATDYFAHLDVMLKSLVAEDVYSVFLKKLLYRAVEADPNFRWCPQCSSGFITDKNEKKMQCRDCHLISCVHCKKPWLPQHERLSCAEFGEWQRRNDPDYQAVGLQRHLLQNDAIACPRCKYRYLLAKGGCMHFTCSMCRFEFCSGCSQPFLLGSRCLRSEYCEKLGLHAHHPRNCLFYLRDKDPLQLQSLLKDSNVSFETERIVSNVYSSLPASSSPSLSTSLKTLSASHTPAVSSSSGDTSGTCSVVEQKDTEKGLHDEQCGRVVQPGHAGFCRMHYVEYLAGLIWRHRLDVLAICDAGDMCQELRRHSIRPRAQRDSETEQQYLHSLRQQIQAEIPLDDTVAD